MHPMQRTGNLTLFPPAATGTRVLFVGTHMVHHSVGVSNLTRVRAAGDDELIGAIGQTRCCTAYIAALKVTDFATDWPHGVETDEPVTCFVCLTPEVV